MRRTSQGGSVFGFIVGGVLLTLLLVGGVYMIRQQTRTVQPAPITEEPRLSPESEQPAPPQETNPQPAPPQQTPTQLPSENVATTPPAPREIPQTGPRETLIGAFAAALLVGTALAYTQSRRSVASL